MNGAVMFYDDNGHLDPRVSEQEIKEEFCTFGVIRKQENNQCQTVTMVGNSSSNTASKPIRYIMFACATCRRQLQMQFCATKVRETATFIAGMSRWSTWKVDGDLDLDYPHGCKRVKHDFV
ncbi:hypothetical protein HanXRQr2_Chr06g0249811 [Helianthus annuus]|uniref:Uncharacterized protein n=1 Tax=Helianthus annuus TaxID=4232 RepID=A0A9K3IRK2_HELAN|nr:hypothetical protein HanXRQr2_Chr06g0249811 [Helianthus annuus]KAJ0559875.1 hypothetical protein HanHA300_Chr06g0205241 [Helianthus annuus]KAJ0572859.1 hypothetical protein HanHA89_Chr06g0220361 [Helianthus annuus]KAJ0737290.1 hypothetical protein HanLR1_Chr06g0205321 [Helianthus annuus]